MEIEQFSKIAQYLPNPLVSVGFVMFLLAGMWYALLKSGLLTRLSQQQSSVIMNRLLKSAFGLAFVLVIVGFGYAMWQDYHSSNGRPDGVSINQQAADCGSNIVGDNNNPTLNCTNTPKPK